MYPVLRKVRDFAGQLFSSGIENSHRSKLLGDIGEARVGLREGKGLSALRIVEQVRRVSSFKNPVARSVQKKT
jgi:hypothetical protein